MKQKNINSQLKLNILGFLEYMSISVNIGILTLVSQCVPLEFSQFLERCGFQ